MHGTVKAANLEVELRCLCEVPDFFLLLHADTGAGTLFDFACRFGDDLVDSPMSYILSLVAECCGVADIAVAIMSGGGTTGGFSGCRKRGGDGERPRCPTGLPR